MRHQCHLVLMVIYVDGDLARGSKLMVQLMYRFLYEGEEVPNLLSHIVLF